MLLKFKKFIISTRIGRGIDIIFRVILSFIPRLHIIFSKKRIFTPDSFVFFLYGGIGDVILTLPLVNKVSSHGNTFILCDKRIHALQFLFPTTVNFILYDKETLLFQSKKLREKIYGDNPVFVQTSPIIEAYFIGRLLRIRNSIGTIVDFNHINSIGFGTKTSISKTKSKIDTYNKIYIKIRKEFGFQELPQELNYIPTKGFQANFKKLTTKYVVISPMKSEQWEMGKIHPGEYAKISDYFVKTYNYRVVFVGSKSESNDIESIIKMTSEVDMMVNTSGKTSMEELSSILYYSEFIIANDNGIAHLSAYLNLKILVMFMFSDPEVYSWNATNYAYLFNDKEKCMPCVSVDKYSRDNYPPLCRNNLACNRSISSEHIIRKIRSLDWV